VKEHFDAELIRGLQRGDEFAFDQIFRKYYKKTYSISLSYLRNREDAEDVVQEVFLNLWRKRTVLRDDYNFKSYLFTITYNTIRNQFRKLSRERKYTEDYMKTFRPLMILLILKLMIQIYLNWQQSLTI